MFRPRVIPGLFLLGFVSTVEALTPIEFSLPEGAINVHLDGVSEHGAVFGDFTKKVDEVFFRHAFVWQNGTLSDIFSEDAAYADVSAVNASGRLIGRFRSTLDSEEHAFTWQDGVLTKLTPANAVRTEAKWVLDDGQVIGWFSEENGDRYFVWKDGVFTPLGPAGARTLGQLTLSPFGRVTGMIRPGEIADSAFTYFDGEFTLVPANAYSSRFVKVSSSGRIVGNYKTSAYGYDMAFTWFDDTLTSLHPSEALQSWATDVNEAGRVVGSYHPRTGIWNRAFTWYRGVWTLLLPAGATGSDVIALNEAGQILGSYRDAASNVHYFVWTNGNLEVISAAGIKVGRAQAFSADGRVIGECKDSLDRSLGYTWQDGAFTLLQPDGAVSSSAESIDDRGFIKGTYSKADDGDLAFVWHDGKMVAFEPPGGMDSIVKVIGEGSQIGGVTRPGTYSPYRALLFQNDTFVDLHPPSTKSSDVWSITPSGRVVGTYESMTYEEGAYGSFTWKDGVLTDLKLPGGSYHRPEYVDGADRIFGNRSVPPQGYEHATSWRDGVFEDYTPVGANGSSFEVQNSRGQLAGIIKTAGQPDRLFFLSSDAPPAPTPSPTPAETPGPYSTPTPTPAPTVASKPPTISRILNGRMIRTKKAKYLLQGLCKGEVTKVTCALGSKSPAIASGTTQWKVRVALAKGRNIFTVTAYGPGGKSQPVKVTITRE